jgi:phosphoribosyl 1,2-cyclic phosphate phosphodiesterase
MKITVLGSGTSIGVPQIGCSCEVCRSQDPKDKRLRCSSLVETADARLLIDCTPDFRQQMLSVPYEPLDGVLITHEHYDHTGGIDDLRPFCRFNGNVDIYLDSHTATHLRQRQPYFFRTKLYPGVARITLHEVTPYDVFFIGHTRITVLPVMHGHMPILGYCIDCPSGKSLGYITDMSTCEERVPELMRGVDVLMVNALRFEPHLAHQTVDEAIQFARKVGAETTRFIHFCHGIGFHEKTDALLPQGIGLAYDGEVLEF